MGPLPRRRLGSRYMIALLSLGAAAWGIAAHDTPQKGSWQELHYSTPTTHRNTALLMTRDRSRSPTNTTFRCPAELTIPDLSW